MVSLHQDKYTFLIISCSVVLKMRNIAEIKEKIRTHILHPITFFEKS